MVNKVIFTKECTFSRTTRVTLLIDLIGWLTPRSSAALLLLAEGETARLPGTWLGGVNLLQWLANAWVVNEAIRPNS